ncbi:transcription termination factor Rho [Luteolibacter ambystomatis]|uniref:Transcription termination factor Rho n=1 Tax=Luteolibacter ambystomatis TaxID=2824561 RepID=A0A975IZV1_9BACT|nr:transcription termination factor Rho [Luteolibacter ambystomatis]QUE51538.1 transcription termination factor Rho [Luteolibacter ambystomatis]
MIHDFNEETLLPFDSIETTGESPAPARKRAAKKTAAKKTAVKKTAAKKTAKKAAAIKDEAVIAPAPEPPAPVPAAISESSETAPVKKKVAKKAAKKAARAAASDEAHARESISGLEQRESAPTPEPVREISSQPAPASSGEEQPRKYGRVPGGGPVNQQREPREPREQREFREPREPREQHGDHPQNREGGGGGPQDGQRDSRSKRRRDKRKRRRERDRERQNDPRGEVQDTRQGQGQRHENHERQDQGERRPQQPQFSGPKVEVNGMLELAPKGFGFLRVPEKRFDQARDDVFVPPEAVRRHGLRVGHWIHGYAQEGPRGPQLVEITTINGLPPEESRKLPMFEELKAINPNKRISFETTPDRFTTRVVDIMAPVGRGQRGLIVSPPRSGKTTLLLHMAEAVREKYDETLHLMIVLVDERPEEVTEFRRALPDVEIYASSNDDGARNHCRIAELAIERAKRLVEAGKDVFLLMDSITRLARAYNHGMRQHGRGTGSGGITVGALEVPRRLFAAARNTRGGGSLTILATALIQTNSKADEAIFQEFKGTGNMELVLDRKIAENYIYPAVDIFKSGTRREELLLAEHMLHKIHLIRRGLSGHRPVEAMERLLFFLKKFPNNPQMLLEIKG